MGVGVSCSAGFGPYQLAPKTKATFTALIKYVMPLVVILKWLLEAGD